MIACIKRDGLIESKTMQKKVNFSDLLSTLKLFETQEEAFSAGYIPIHFTTTLRTAYSNKVVEHKDHKYYQSIVLGEYLMMTGLDLVMYMTSVAVTKCLDVMDNKNTELLMTSQFLPIGLYNPDMGVLNPVLYCQVVFRDDLSEVLRSSLTDGNKLIDISDMNHEGNLSELIKSIIEVKEES